MRRFFITMARTTGLLVFIISLGFTYSFADEAQAPEQTFPEQAETDHGDASENRIMPNGIYLHPNVMNVYVDKNGSDRNNCTADSRCLTINRALQTVPAIARGSINIHIGPGVYKENIRLIGFPLVFSNRISFIGTYDAQTGEPVTIIDNENVRPFAFQIQQNVQVQIQDIKIINVMSGQSAIAALEHVYLYLYNVHVKAPSTRNTLCIQAKTHSHLYSKRTNIDGCNVGVEAVNSSVLHAGYGSSITGKHSGGEAGSSSTLTDPALNQPSGRLVGAKLDNNTDGSTCKITSNDSRSHTVTCRGGLTGGKHNYWSRGDSYTIHEGSDTYANTTWAGLYYSENTSGVVSHSYFTNNVRSLEVRYQSRANMIGNTFTDNKIAISAWDASSLYDAGGNTFTGNKSNFDIRTTSSYTSPKTSHSVPCVVARDCSDQTGEGYCCWNSSNNRLYFGNGSRAVEVGR